MSEWAVAARIRYVCLCLYAVESMVFDYIVSSMELHCVDVEKEEEAINWP